MKPKSSLQCSQDAATGPYPEPDESSPQPPSLFLKIHSNIIFPSTPRSSNWSLLFRFSKQKFFISTKWQTIYRYRRLL